MSILENIGMTTYNSTTVNQKTKTDETATSKNYGRTIGNPELSKEAAEYYKELKEKYSNLDFILVSKDQKQQAQAQAGRYANAQKMVVLIDEEKIEKMVTDENYRKYYEGIIASAANKMPELASSVASTGATVKGFGMQVNDNGTTTYFAVLEKASQAQKERIEKKAEEKAEAKKEAKKKAAEELAEKRAEKNSNEVTITASSMEELVQKIQDYLQNELTNSVQTDAEKLVGQHFDVRG